MRKLEIGPGVSPLGNSWETIQHPKDVRFNRSSLDHHCIWGSEVLPFEDNQFDMVYTSHCIEHVPWFNTLDALKEVHRILKSNGVFEIWTVNFYYLVRCYMDNQCGDNWRKYNPSNNPMVWLNGRVFTYGDPLDTSDPTWHRALFDEKYLSQLLTRVEFTKIQRIDHDEKPRGHDHGPINLGFRCIKP